ncbi:response regulator [Acidobacteriota bacterium]
MINILIADDHSVIREGLKKILSENGGKFKADEASNGQTTLKKIWENDYDVVVLDISMPGKNGIDILKQVKEIKPTLPVLILSMYPEDQFAVRVLKCGAAGYLTKEKAPDELKDAINKVLEGRKYISSSLAEKLASDLELNYKKPSHERLSDREYQVMCMIATGKTLKEISEELALSITTISTYRSRILKKMKLKNNAEISYYAIKHELVK